MTNAERKSFQPPLRSSRGVYFPFQPASGWREKYGRASENFKVTQTLCGSEIPPCFPTTRRSQETIEIFGYVSLCFSCCISSLSIVSSLFPVTPKDKTSSMPRLVHDRIGGIKAKRSLGFTLVGYLNRMDYRLTGSSTAHTNR